MVSLFFKQGHGQAVLILSVITQLCQWVKIFGNASERKWVKKCLMAVGENFPESWGWNWSPKCYHKNTGEDNHLRKLVKIKMLLKENCQNCYGREIAM